MEVADIKAHIKTKQFKPLYIFSGTEWKVQRIYIDTISTASGRPLYYVDSIADIYGKLNNKSFIKNASVYVIRDDKEIIQNEKLQAQLETLLGDNILILLLTTVDKRTKFYKTYKDLIVEFTALKPDILCKYLQKEIDLSNTNCNKLMEACEYDYGRCLLEIDKVKQYTLAYYNGQQLKPGAFDKTFITLYENGTIYQPPKDAIFDFVDAVLDVQLNETFNLYRQCLEVKEAVMVMISVLYNNARAVLQVQSCESNDISKSTGLTGWQIQNAKKHLHKRSTGELINILKICQECQQGIVTGTIEEEFVMDYILVNLF